MISGDGGWSSGVLSFAETFSEMNSLVIGVDILRYFKDLRQRTDDCYTVAADFVQLATEIEKKYDFPYYKSPVIMGYSSGATLVYGILAQARPGTFIGGISVGFCPDIELPKMLCQTNGLIERVDVTGKSYFLRPDRASGET
jgi:type IV secretory pathway VirJ component